MTVSVLLGAALVSLFIISFFPHRWVEFIRKEIEERAALIQLLVLTILIATFALYWQANEINRKANIIAHTPWLKIIPKIQLVPSPDDKLLIISAEAENTSDSPTLYTTISYICFPSQGAPDSNTVANVVPADVTVMPHTTVPFEMNITEDASNPNKFSAHSFKERIEKGEVAVRLIATYRDIFGDSLTVSSELCANPYVEGIYDVRRNSATGFPTY